MKDIPSWPLISYELKKFCLAVQRVIICWSNNGEIAVDLNIGMKDRVNMREIVKLVNIAVVKEYKFKIVF